MALFYANEICESKYFTLAYFIQTVSESIDATFCVMIDADMSPPLLKVGDHHFLGPV